MSLVAGGIHVEPKRSTVTDFSDEQYNAYLGGSEITYKTVIAQSYNSSQVSFNAQPPSPSNITDRQIMLRCPVKMTMVGTPQPLAKLIQSGFDAFRAFPLASCMTALKLSINGTAITTQPKELITAMMQFNGSQDNQEFLSATPNYPDQSQLYTSMTGKNRNPLGAYGEMSDSSPRGAFPYTSVINPATGAVASEETAVVEAVLTEPLFISPLLYSKFESKGLVGVQNLTVDCMFSDLTRMWSHNSDSDSTITSIKVEFTSPPSLLLKYITPSLVQEIPKEINYKYQNMEVQATDHGAQVLSGQTAVITSSNISLNVVPRGLMIWAREREGDRTYTDCDSLLSLENLQVSWANQPAIFSGASKQELYAISKRNGSNQTWGEWGADTSFFESGGSNVPINGVGGVFMAIFGKDIPLSDPSVITGTAGVFSLQVKGTFKNQNQLEAVYPTIYVVPVYDGIFSIRGLQGMPQLSVLSQADVLLADKKADTEGGRASVSEGGSFWGDVKTGWEQALPIIRKGRKVGQTVAPAFGPEGLAVKAGLDVAEQLGLGRTGGRRVGGAKMTRAEMKQSLGL